MDGIVDVSLKNIDQQYNEEFMETLIDRATSKISADDVIYEAPIYLSIDTMLNTKSN